MERRPPRSTRTDNSFPTRRSSDLRASRRCGRRTGGCGTRPRGRGRAACRITSERPDGVAVRPFSLPRRVIMADRVSASIAIGGKVSPTQLAELAAHIADYDLRIEWDGEPFDPIPPPPEDALGFFTHRVPGGIFATLTQIRKTSVK